MLKHPRFKPHLRVQVIPGEGAFVVSDARQALLRGRLYEVVVPSVDGRPADDLCDHLQEQVAPAEVYFVLGQLEQKGFLCEEDVSVPPREAALWSAQEIDPPAAARRLAQTPIVVHGFGVETTELRELLQSLRVRVEEEAALAVVLADTYLRSDLQEFNAEALRLGRSWLLVRPVGRQLWIGPLFRPGATGCWECLAQRLCANCPVETYLDGKNGRPRAAADRACTPATMHVAWGLTANAVTTWIARGDLPVLEGKLQTFDLASWQLRTHVLIRLPYCPTCGEPRSATDSFAPPALLSQAKTFTARRRASRGRSRGDAGALRSSRQPAHGCRHHAGARRAKGRRRPARLPGRAQPGSTASQPGPFARRLAKHEFG